MSSFVNSAAPRGREKPPPYPEGVGGGAVTDNQISMLRWYDPSRRDEDSSHFVSDIDRSHLEDHGLIYRVPYKSNPKDLVTGQGRAYLARLELSDD